MSAKFNILIISLILLIVKHADNEYTPFLILFLMKLRNQNLIVKNIKLILIF